MIRDLSKRLVLSESTPHPAVCKACGKEVQTRLERIFERYGDKAVCEGVVRVLVKHPPCTQEAI